MGNSSGAQIHPSAIIHPGARIGAEVRVGPYCIIGEEVEIGDGTELMAHIFMEGPLRVGTANKFFPYCSIGVVPQDLKFEGERSETIIGSRNTIREFVTIHRGTKGGGAITSMGDGNLLMAYTHVAHDCRIGNHNVLANGTTLAGHVIVEDYTVIGAFSGIHQFSRIGRHSLLGAYSLVAKDVLPFSKTVSEREAKVFGINSVGLKRHGFGPERREQVAHAIRLLTASGLNTSQAVEQSREEIAGSEDV